MAGLKSTCTLKLFYCRFTFVFYLYMTLLVKIFLKNDN